MYPMLYADVHLPTIVNVSCSDAVCNDCDWFTLLNGIFRLLLQCLVTVLILGIVTCIFLSKYTTLFSCCSVNGWLLLF